MKVHMYFSCDICFAGFVSETILVKHKLHDHPKGPPPPQEPQAEPAPKII